MSTKKSTKAPVFQVSEIQQKINEDLLKRINILAFRQEVITKKIKNTFGIKCKQCGSENIYMESKQTRSADEATTKIYECLDCGNMWRVY